MDSDTYGLYYTLIVPVVTSGTFCFRQEFGWRTPATMKPADLLVHASLGMLTAALLCVTRGCPPLLERLLGWTVAGSGAQTKAGACQPRETITKAHIGIAKIAGHTT